MGPGVVRALHHPGLCYLCFSHGQGRCGCLRAHSCITLVGRTRYRTPLRGIIQVICDTLTRHGVIYPMRRSKSLAISKGYGNAWGAASIIRDWDFLVLRHLGKTFTSFMMYHVYYYYLLCLFFNYFTKNIILPCFGPHWQSLNIQRTLLFFVLCNRNAYLCGMHTFAH